MAGQSRIPAAAATRHGRAAMQRLASSSAWNERQRVAPCYDEAPNRRLITIYSSKCMRAEAEAAQDSKSSSSNKDQLGRTAVAGKQQRYTQLLNKALQDHGERGQIPVRHPGIGVAAFYIHPAFHMSCQRCTTSHCVYFNLLRHSLVGRFQAIAVQTGRKRFTCMGRLVWEWCTYNLPFVPHRQQC